MEVNVGNADRIVRLALGVLLIAVAFFSGLAIFESGVVRYGAAAIGLVLAVTGLMRTCPLYSILGIRTCKV